MIEAVECSGVVSRAVAVFTLTTAEATQSEYQRRRYLTFLLAHGNSLATEERKLLNQERKLPLYLSSEGTALYICDEGNLLQETDGSGATQAHYTDSTAGWGM